MSLDNEELTRLQALPLPRCGPLSVTVKPKKYGDEPISCELDGFDHFLPPHGGCVNCGEKLGGMFGSFSWGMFWGQGSCSCGYPGRAYHKVNLPDGTEDTLQLIMQYHPDELKERDENE